MSYTKVAHQTTYASISPVQNAALAASFANKTVLITGAGTGIGRDTAISFARTGAKHLILFGRRQSALDDTVKAVQAANPQVMVAAHSVDVRDADAVARALSRDGPIDVAVHAAAAHPPLGPLATESLEDIWDAFEVNVKGTLVVARAVLAHNEKAQLAHEAVFVHLGTAGVIMPPMPGMGPYIATKIPSVKLVEYLDAEIRGKLRTVSVHPGLVKTDFSNVIEEKTGLKFPYNDRMCPFPSLLLPAECLQC
jgi:NADP-dependent 3-hydroxy acid dehydrogenase YdfG